MNGLIFDWDNTLIDTIGVIKKSLIETLEKFEYSGDIDKLIKSAGIHLSMREGFPLVFGDKWQEAGHYFYSRYEQNQHLITKIDGFDELIEYLKTLDIPLAINSNKKQQHLENEIKQFELNELFPVVMGSGACQNDKPAPDGVNKICDLWKIKPNKDIYYIGDSPTDYKTAQNSGINCIMVGADIYGDVKVCNGLPELLKTLKNI